MKFINHFWSTFWNLLRTVCKAKKIFLNKLIGFVIYPVEFAYDSSTNWSMKKNLHLKVPGRNPHNFWISCLFVDSSKSEHGSRRICSTNKGSIWTSSRTIEAILKFTSLKLKDGAHIRSLRFEECDLVLFVYELKQRKFGLCQVLNKFRPNTFCIDLPKGFSIVQL